MNLAGVFLSLDAEFLAAVQLLLHCFQPAHNGTRFRPREDPGLLECLAMGDAPGDVFAIEPTIDGHRPGKRFDQLVGLLSKPTVPGLSSTAD